ncbi:hypothetical protein A8924_6517 [Saccharopolyspora erythraea NRRL 2338]|uniref:Uncharacterized protein n=2 Tax=Saccharopolyspora erythraea TaxID=1836 RepID=A4FMR7_SACEN|nr:hypothetical protein [Saccharopolyspora erythraea]EQD85962.1 hypothetical protein N599_12105 [Saccharopolyspora erythraea D]PFG98987.1 hypothetical protein A8924_6517 [Saccharopolyspora erythraea NRRL 2338]QRK88960.1 hypothetical protein JQX30_30905 [Saccharopolyspora erythraea]CAM05342.1 hypothetical protein SACE_6169 [Saccharopolyspora erythraea NRRL 2338]
MADSSPHPDERSFEPAVHQQHTATESIRALSSISDPDYVDLFTMAAGLPGTSAEQWARTATEDALGRQAQVLWRGLLGLRLKSAPDRVAGWRLGGRGDTWVRLEASSWFMTANLVLEAGDDHVSLATFVRYDRLLARRVWEPLSRKQRQIVPGLLRTTYQRLERKAQAA